MSFIYKFINIKGICIIAKVHATLLKEQIENCVKITIHNTYM